jgi:multidrug efflux pump subunit AcrA (membrane-fusion protein)
VGALKKIIAVVVVAAAAGCHGSGSSGRDALLESVQVVTIGTQEVDSTVPMKGRLLPAQYGVTGALELDGKVEADVVPSLHPGTVVSFHSDVRPDLPPAQGTFIAASSVAKGNMVLVRFALPNLPDGYYQDLDVVGDVILEQHKDAVAVPRLALEDDVSDPHAYQPLDRMTVYVVTPDARGTQLLHRRSVTLGICDGSVCEVTNGLSAGERVCIRGMAGMADGQAVEAVPGSP